MQTLTGATRGRRIVMPSASGAGSAPPPATLSDLLPCQHGGGEKWFSELPDELEQAKVCCQQCPLRTACLAGALERAEPYGVWGGEIFHKGAIIARKRPRGRPPRTRPDAGKGHCGRPTAQREDHASIRPSAAGC
ncbi:MAG TPA: WhiB family transcriptional regulator [Streptosporangiaceae bacterium]